MKTKAKAFISMLPLLITPSALFAGVTIDASTWEDIRSVLSKPVPVYQLDLKERQQVFNRVDAFFSEHINFRKGTEKRNKKRAGSTFRIQVINNKPIPPTKESVEGIRNDAPFTVWYVKTPQKRSFMKEIRSPVPTRLPDEHITKLGREFITRNQLCKTNAKDRVGDALMLTRNSQPLSSVGKSEEKLAISQRVIFEREFNGLPVVNSRQIVGIHPESREILAYKTINWTPVAEHTAKAKSYITEKQLMEQLAKGLGKTEAEYTAYRVKSGMYQSETSMVPVLMVYLRKAVAGDDIPEMDRVVVISLMKGVEIGGEKRDLKRPVEVIK